MSKNKKLTKKAGVHKYRPGTYTGRKTQVKGSNKIAPSQKDMVLEIKKELLADGGGSVSFDSAVVLVKKNFHRTKQDSVFVLYNMEALGYLKIEGGGKNKTVSFLI